jgi:hypothetical protein
MGERRERSRERSPVKRDRSLEKAKAGRERSPEKAKAGRSPVKAGRSPVRRERSPRKERSPVKPRPERSPEVKEAGALGSKVEKAEKPEVPKFTVDRWVVTGGAVGPSLCREKTCPLLLRVFCSQQRHNNMSEYMRGWCLTPASHSPPVLTPCPR